MVHVTWYMYMWAGTCVGYNIHSSCVFVIHYPANYWEHDIGLVELLYLYNVSGLPPDLDDACYDKVALLIGNKQYQRDNLKLNTPENDTQDMAGVLLSAGFKVVSLVNLNKIEMEMVRTEGDLVGLMGFTEVGVVNLQSKIKHSQNLG